MRESLAYTSCKKLLPRNYLKVLLVATYVEKSMFLSLQKYYSLCLNTRGILTLFLAFMLKVMKFAYRHFYRTASVCIKR